MSGLGSEREKPWNIYTSPDPNPPQLEAATHLDSSMNAISFCLVATAIFISMFLIMAIFEHLFKPVQPDLPGSSPSSSDMQKPPLSSEPDSALCMSGFSVVMPGQHCPTHIAKPAPLPPPPCSREGINWPQHEHG